MSETINITQEESYNKAMQLISDSITPALIQNALQIFTDLGDYKDSKRYADRCARYLAYQKGCKVSFGNYKGKPINWTVIATHGTRSLILSDDTIENIPFHPEREEIDWNSCDLRKWMNRTFLEEAFTLQERMYIMITKLENNTDPRWDVANGPDTKDKAFVFTKAELNMYLPKKEDRAIGKWWWLRGHGSSNLSQLAIYEDGAVYENGINTNSLGVGVRAAMWVRTNIK